ncbi:MAG: NADPH-dependent F420 reductase [Chloroflexi bacterium]|nr:NADPH-dependent F420 reductase [Chloroflexota bacterium]
MLGFIGGTGPEGKGLALRLALAGEQVVIGSRDEGRAREAADSLSEHLPPGAARGALNRDVAKESDVVFVVVPYAAQKDTLWALKDELAGKIVVDVVAPLEFVKGRASAVRVEEGSAALQAQAILPDSRIVAAFQTISARDLLEPGKPLDTDVIVCADDEDAKAAVMRLAETISGVRAVNGGGLENARYVEDFTALLLNINRIYKARSKIKIVGI